MSIFDWLWNDPKLEGEKEGLAKGNMIYKKPYETLEAMYKEEQRLFQNKIRQYEVYNIKLIDYKENLEKIIRDLESKIRKKGDIDLTGNITGACMMSLAGGINIREIAYFKGFTEGYNRAKALYERKTESLIENRSSLIAKSKRDIGKYNSLKDDILRDIYKDLEKIAEYQVLLSGGKS